VGSAFRSDSPDTEIPTLEVGAWADLVRSHLWTKLNASKPNAMSYEFMKKKQAELQAKVEELLRAAERADEGEDARYERAGAETSFRLSCSRPRFARDSSVS
jgi:hypothetical protein